jgi:hypothetical protein
LIAIKSLTLLVNRPAFSSALPQRAAQFLAEAARFERHEDEVHDHEADAAQGRDEAADDRGQQIDDLAAAQAQRLSGACHVDAPRRQFTLPGGELRIEAGFVGRQGRGELRQR